jgi:hypothetical protein
MFCCPRFGGIGSLVDCVIGADGAVTPRVVCPYDGCTFRALVRLNGWNAIQR